MNERAREVLVAAALRGVRQIKGHLTDGQDGRCALGVLAEEAFGVARAAESAKEWDEKFGIPYGLHDLECESIQHANDILSWDFLTIARKIGTPEYDDAVNTKQEDSK